MPRDGCEELRAHRLGFLNLVDATGSPGIARRTDEPTHKPVLVLRMPTRKRALARLRRDRRLGAVISG
jgi:hypothetical protein